MITLELETLTSLYQLLSWEPLAEKSTNLVSTLNIINYDCSLVAERGELLKFRLFLVDLQLLLILRFLILGFLFIFVEFIQILRIILMLREWNMHQLRLMHLFLNLPVLLFWNPVTIDGCYRVLGLSFGVSPLRNKSLLRVLAFGKNVGFESLIN